MNDINTDSSGPGRKQAQHRISKKVKSANIRQRRLAGVASLIDKHRNPIFCTTCGFRVRSTNHSQGSHHVSMSKKGA